MSTFPSFLFFFQIIPALLGKSTQKAPSGIVQTLKARVKISFRPAFPRKGSELSGILIILEKEFGATFASSRSEI